MAQLFVTLTVLCLFGAVLGQAFDKKAAMAKFMKKVDNCKTVVGATDADIREMVDKNQASTMTGKCLRSCLMKQYKLMNSNGKFVKSVALSLSQKYNNGDANKMATVVAIISACSDIAVPSDECEAAEQYANCFKEQAIAHGIIKLKPT